MLNVALLAPGTRHLDCQGRAAFRGVGSDVGEGEVCTRGQCALSRHQRLGNWPHNFLTSWPALLCPEGEIDVGSPADPCSAGDQSAGHAASGWQAAFTAASWPAGILPYRRREHGLLQGSLRAEASSWPSDLAGWHRWQRAQAAWPRRPTSCGPFAAQRMLQ